MTLSVAVAPSHDIRKVDCCVIFGEVEVVVARAPAPSDEPVQRVPVGPVTVHEEAGVSPAALNERSVVASTFTRSGFASM